MARILLVDADEDSAEQLSAALRRSAGYDVTRVSSVLDAIREAGASHYDAAVLDHRVPDGPGMDILDFLRIGSPRIGIIVMAAASTERDAFHALSHGAGDFITKDAHVALELPGRVAAMLQSLDRGAEVALVATLHPTGYDDARFGYASPPTPGDAVSGPPVAIGLFDPAGDPVLFRPSPGAAPSRVGAAFATLRAEAPVIWAHAGAGSDSLLVRVDEGLLGMRTISRTLVLAALFKAPTSRKHAIDELAQVAQRIRRTLGR